MTPEQTNLILGAARQGLAAVAGSSDLSVLVNLTSAMLALAQETQATATKELGSEVKKAKG